uniref:Uncharacterized protein n=1 Tax=viral metagenome TaxID=1070528 RepID=A0A6C0AME5_9ZZZZ
MSYKNNQNRTNPKQEIPVLSKDEIASIYASRAEAVKAVQIYRADGSPIVGALISYDTTIQAKQKIYKGKNVDCKLLCCSERRPLVKQQSFSQVVSYPDSCREYQPQEGEWITDEDRSTRRLKKRAYYAKVEERNANALYAMYDD